MFVEGAWQVGRSSGYSGFKRSGEATGGALTPSWIVRGD
jgi:hypothetical protein